MACGRLSDIAGGWVAAWRRGRSGMRLGRRRRPREIHEITVRVSGKPLDVFGIGEGVFLGGRRVTAHAVKAKPGKWNCKGRIVIVDALRVPEFSPVPTILGSLRVLHHDGPAINPLR